MLQINNFGPKCRGSPSDWGVRPEDTFGGMRFSSQTKRRGMEEMSGERNRKYGLNIRCAQATKLG